jgi:cytoskeleton protein RodZ
VRIIAATPRPDGTRRHNSAEADAENHHTDARGELGESKEEHNEEMAGGVGATLREARAQRGVDLAEVEASTKIQARFLRAMEDEEWDLLPAEFYARAFLRTYATYLGLDGAGLVEEYRRGHGPAGPAEQLPRIDPAPPQLADSVHRKHLSRRHVSAIASVGLVAVLVVIGLSNLGGGSTRPPPPGHQAGGGRHAATGHAEQRPARRPGTTLSLTASAEVWVCLLDAKGRPLIDGQILSSGSEEGPYRSGSFTVSLGNGAVTMTVAGKPASIPPTPNPIGFSIAGGGALRELPEAERPTCT